jgi:hypothetical protein
MMGKSVVDDKRRCPPGGMQRRHDRVSGAVIPHNGETQLVPNSPAAMLDRHHGSAGRTIKK